MLYNTHLNSILTKSFRCVGHLSDYEALVAAKQLRLCGGAFYFYLIIIPYLIPFVNLFLENKNIFKYKKQLISRNQTYKLLL